MKILSLQYKIVNSLAFICWALLIIIPTATIIDTLIADVVIVGLSVFYFYLLFVAKDVPGEQYPKGNFTSLAGVVNLFANPRGVLVGWVHYLAFDLLVGLHIKAEATALGMSHWLQIPCFILTFIFGPLGYLLFFILARVWY